MLEGLRLRMDHALRIIDRGMILEAARHALRLHAWLTSPDFDQEGDIQRAEAALATQSAAVARRGSVRCEVGLAEGGTVMAAFPAHCCVAGSGKIEW